MPYNDHLFSKDIVLGHYFKNNPVSENSVIFKSDMKITAWVRFAKFSRYLLLENFLSCLTNEVTTKKAKCKIRLNDTSKRLEGH